MLPSTQRRKAQSAMEYLMTYGWAILIIAVVLGALFSLGVFSGSNLLGSACVAGSGYLCQNPTFNHGVISAGSTAGNIVVTVGQNTGQNWGTANIVFVPQGTTSVAGLPSVSFNAFNSIGATPGLANQIVSGLVTGQTQTITLPVSGLSSGTVSVGQAATGALWVQYTTTGGAVQYAQLASINIKAS